MFDHGAGFDQTNMSLPDAEAPDPLVSQTAKKLTDIMNDFKAQINTRDDSNRTHVVGKIKLTLKSQCYMLTIAALEGVHAVKVQVQPMTLRTLKEVDIPATRSTLNATISPSDIDAISSKTVGRR